MIGQVRRDEERQEIIASGIHHGPLTEDAPTD